MKIIRPVVLYKCKTHRILPDAIWGAENNGHGTMHFYCYRCRSCPGENDYFHLAYGVTKANAEMYSREFWNGAQ